MYKIQSSHPPLIEFSIPETIRIIGTKISGMFGWTSVTCDWLMVGLNTINQS